MTPSLRRLEPERRPRSPKAHEGKRARARRASRQRRHLLAVGGAVAAAATFLLATALMPPPPAGTNGLKTFLHQHVHLELVIAGEAQVVPVDIGIDADLWKDHSMDAYGQMNGMSPLHTHDTSGTVHLEYGTWHPCTLGDFFAVWGQPLGPGGVLGYSGPVTMTVDDRPSTEFGALLLQDGQHVVLTAG